MKIKMGLLIVNDWPNPYIGKQMLHPSYIRTIRSLMFTGDLYDESGEYFFLNLLNESNRFFINVGEKYVKYNYSVLTDLGRNRRTRWP